ncbi:TIGR03943 family putative permease subunit [Paenibacillus sp. y28]|uniref:TIGR03943 family putative permease subunit n=1 Tax=Paenibacillus sp. y28 TaxID=3129110 RepID=UPI00301A621F
MISMRRLALHHLLRALILFGFALYILMLVRSEGILLYIAPRMLLYVKLSALGLYLVSAYQAYQGIKAWRGYAAACDCDHGPSPSFIKNSLIYSLFCLPLALGFLLPDATMGSALASNKGMAISGSGSLKANTAGTPSAAPDRETAPSGEASAPSPEASSPAAGSGSAAAGEAELDKLFPYDKFTEHFARHAKKLYKQPVIRIPEDTYLETLTTLDLFTDSFAGKTIEIEGFVYRNEDMNNRQFVVGRFGISCCAADAAPVGLLVQYDGSASFPQDTWVRATGTVIHTKYMDMDLIAVQADTITAINAPKNQYVYPNYEFGQEP